MSPHYDRSGSEFGDIAQMLRDEYGEATGLELDRAKQLARSRAMQPRSATKGVRMRPARKTLALILAVGVVGGGSGAAFVVAKGGHHWGPGGYPTPPGLCKKNPTQCPK